MVGECVVNLLDFLLYEGSWFRVIPTNHGVGGFDSNTTQTSIKTSDIWEKHQGQLVAIVEGSRWFSGMCWVGIHGKASRFIEGTLLSVGRRDLLLCFTWEGRKIIKER